MTTTEPVLNRQIESRSFSRLAKEGGARKRYSLARVRIALRKRLKAGWLPVTPAGRLPHERMVFVWREHPLADIVGAFICQQRWFLRTKLEAAIGQPLDSREGVLALATAGLAIMREAGLRIELRAADPRVAQLVNLARLGPQRRRYQVHRVLEAVLALPPKKKRRRSATIDRRMDAAHILQDEWLLNGDDLLNGQPLVRLSSDWALSSGSTTIQPVGESNSEKTISL